MRDMMRPENSAYGQFQPFASKEGACANTRKGYNMSG